VIHNPSRLAAFGVVALCVLGYPGQAAGQYPRARRGQFEVRGFDFRPDGAWRKRTFQIRQYRQQLLRSGAMATLNAGPVGTRVSGSFNIPVLPVTFSNVAPPFTVAQYQDVLFNPVPTAHPYSVKTFYEQVSNNALQINGVVQNWVTADSADTYYEDNCNGIGVLNPCPHGGTRMGQLLLEVLQTNDAAGLDWGQFDNDGSDGVPNSGDDDGIVDFVTFIQSDVDGACGTQHIWAHRYVISGWNGGSPYVTQAPWAGHPGQFIKVEDYTIQSGQGGNTACTQGQIMPIGTVAHETGHAFGLPDLYDTNLNSASVTEGIGEWGLMGSGNYARPYSPSRFEAWSLSELGWVTVDTLSASGTVTLGPVQTSDTVLYVPVPNTDEYFLLENRQSLESDTAQMNPAFGVRQKSPGLLIWHIDQGQINLHGFQSDNMVNSGPVHGVALIQADNLNELRTPGGGDRGDTGDSYPGIASNHRASAQSGPPLLNNQGGFAGFAIDSIFPVTPGVPGPMVFRFLNRARSVVAASVTGALVKVNGVLTPRFDDILAPGDTLAVDVDSQQVSANGKGRFTFQAWSDAQPASHVFIQGPQPDTLVATFSAEYRVKTNVAGSGAVQASVAGDPDTGIFVVAGTSITLTAQPASGETFTGWSGDTTATNPVLTLPMQRGYDVTATFTAAVAVSLTEAVNEVLGTPALTPAQRSYLDQIGNRNGRYDVGDFLAYLTTTGQAVPPALMRHVLTGRVP